jgi:hypothetical protein
VLPGAQAGQQRHHARVSEAQAGGGWAVVDDGSTIACRAVGSGAHWQAFSWAISSRALMSWPRASSVSQLCLVRVRLTPKS